MTETETALAHLLQRVARGDHGAFEELYTRMSGSVYGLVRRVLKDPAQSEEVAQEVLVEVWRTAPKYDPARGTVSAWILTLAHRRAVDRVRSAQASRLREWRAGRVATREYDEVAESVEAALEQESVRNCLRRLTDLQRQSVTLAYYDGYTYPEVAKLLELPLGTVKTRMRDGLSRLRDCLAGAR